MPSSSLTPDNFPAGPDRNVTKGHGIGALGPSDSSDSGSDVMGGPGFASQVDGFGLDHPGTTSDPEASFGDHTAGPDLGDSNLDSDSDRNGTGERAAASRDTVTEDGADIGVDHIEYFPELDDDGSEKKRPH